MAIRVTQSQMYGGYIRNMNRTLSNLVETNLQSATQLRINRPSDDPAGAGRVIAYRATLSSIGQYQSNLSTAAGWLSTADTLLSSEGSVMTALTRFLELAEQGASGTYTSDQRKQIASEMRQLYEHMIMLANTSFNGKHIFSGTKTGESAYVQGLAAHSNDANLAGQNLVVEGGASSTVLIKAASTGQAGDPATFLYSEDGGDTWLTATVDALSSPPYEAGKVRINAGGVGVILDASTQVTEVDFDNVNETDNGTWIYVRPTAVYQGDDNSNQVVMSYGTGTTGSAQGNFSRDVTVRVDKVENGVITYSYSTDDGNNWVQATAADNGAGSRLPVPGGYLTLDNSPAAGEQYVIHPHRAEISIAISDTDSLVLNLIGKDVFGGLYLDPASGLNYATAVTGQPNLFETIGKLIGYADTGSQQGMQESLDELKAVMNHIVSKAAEVGGRENRLTSTQQTLYLRKIQEEDGLSAVEDADLTELLTRLAQQEVAYNSVLKSSSMIMQMSLVNYL